jgi:hypothetical protein
VKCNGKGQTLITRDRKNGTAIIDAATWKLDVSARRKRMQTEARTPPHHVELQSNEEIAKINKGTNKDHIRCQFRNLGEDGRNVNLRE